MTNIAAVDKGEVSEMVVNTFLFFGIALAVLGILAVIFSGFVTMGTVICIGGLLVAAAIAQFIKVFRAWQGGKGLLHILSGLLYLIVGGLTIYNPVLGAISLTFVMSAFFIAAGILRCCYAIAHRKERIWPLFLFSGVVDLCLGYIIASGWPITGLWVIGLFVGIEMLVHGITWIVLSMALKKIGSTNSLAKA